MAEVITAEMGCPITASRLGQVGEAYAAWNYFAELGRTLTWEEERPGRVVALPVPTGAVLPRATPAAK